MYALLGDIRHVTVRDFPIVAERTSSRPFEPSAIFMTPKLEDHPNPGRNSSMLIAPSAIRSMVPVMFRFFVHADFGVGEKHLQVGMDAIDDRGEVALFGFALCGAKRAGQEVEDPPVRD